MVSWKDITDKLPGFYDDTQEGDYMRTAEEYYCNFYWGDDPAKRYSEKEAADIVAEIVEEAQHKLRLLANAKAREKLLKECPWFQVYLQRAEIREDAAEKKRAADAMADAHKTNKK
jgi:hypothetical protein